MNLPGSGSRKSADERMAEWRAKLPRTLAIVAIAAVFFQVVVPALQPEGVSLPQMRSPLDGQRPEAVDCDLLRRAGQPPAHQGDPTYIAALDTDGDGISCETDAEAVEASGMGAKAVKGR